MLQNSTKKVVSASSSAIIGSGCDSPSSFSHSAFTISSPTHSPSNFSSNHARSLFSAVTPKGPHSPHSTFAASPFSTRLV